MIPAHSVARLLSNIFGPSPEPWIGCGDLDRRRVILDLASGPRPEPWRWLSPPWPWSPPWQEAALNPQPLPPGERHALALADAHIQEVFALDRAGAFFGAEVARRAEEQALQLVAEIDELCPVWPRWPRGWLPPPRWPSRGREEMTPTELLLFGTRLLAGSEALGQGRLQDALADLGAKVLNESLNR